jgi:hypothetical protein
MTEITYQTKAGETRKIELPEGSRVFTGFLSKKGEQIFDGDAIEVLSPRNPAIKLGVPPGTAGRVTWDAPRGAWHMQYVVKGNVLSTPIPGEMLEKTPEGVRLGIRKHT